MCNRKCFCIVFKTAASSIVFQDLNMPRLTNSQRHEAVGMLRVMSVNEVARHFNCHRATIHKLKSRVQMTGTVKDLPRSGKPRVTSAADDRRIVTTNPRDWLKTMVSTDLELINDTSDQSVSQRLKSVGLLCRRPAKKSRLIDRHKRARLDYATRYRRYTQRQWSNFSFF